MTNNENISIQTQELLNREGGGQVRFSDVYPELVTAHEPEWWRKIDFDGALTDEVESTGFPKVTQVPIGLRPELAKYGLVLVDDLVRARNDRIADIDPAAGVHPDIAREISEAGKATIALANYAPRDDANTANGSNGSDFYLATTDAGLEVYATPLSFLSGLEARDRLTALYRIPTKGHPEFNGDHEQFRSARVTRTRRHPDHLETVFEYADQAALLEAKANGTHPREIPTDSRDGWIGFVDKFGNVRLDLQDRRVLQDLELGSYATLLVTNNEIEHKVRVQAAEDLHSAPIDQLVVYSNCSDHVDEGSSAGLVELITKVNGNPSTSRKTAMFQLLEQIPDLDPATAEVRLVA